MKNQAPDELMENLYDSDSFSFLSRSSSFLFLSQTLRPKCEAVSGPSRYTGAREAGPRLAEYQSSDGKEEVHMSRGPKSKDLEAQRICEEG